MQNLNNTFSLSNRTEEIIGIIESGKFDVDISTKEINGNVITNKTISIYMNVTNSGWDSSVSFTLNNGANSGYYLKCFSYSNFTIPISGNVLDVIKKKFVKQSLRDDKGKKNE